MSNMELTILMPCLNEARTLEGCIREAQSYIERAQIPAEVLVSDNGSTDGSVELAQSLGARVIHVPERGYGAALIEGIRGAEGRYIIMGDSDGSYDFAHLDAFVKALQSGAELVIGNRFRGGIEPSAMPWLHRYLGNPVLSWLARRFFKTNVGDFHCGLRGVSRQSMLNLGLAGTGMEFATEMVAKAALSGCRIEEVPTILRRDGRDRPPHLRTWRDGWRHLLFMLLFSPQWLFTFPGMLLSILGTAGVILLWQEALKVGSLGFDIHSMLYASGMLIIGVQLIQFGILSKWIGAVAGVVSPQRWMVRLSGLVRIEYGLIAGAALFFGGIIWSMGLAEAWSRGGYGELDPQRGMRSVIPSVTMMILGLQACAGSLLAGALSLVWKGRKQ